MKLIIYINNFEVQSMIYFQKKVAYPRYRVCFPHACGVATRVVRLLARAW
jgi:hypothetical protein